MPDLDKSEFMANGKKYLIEGALSIERYAELQILEKEMAYSMSFKVMSEKLNQLAKLINKMEFGKAAVLLNDIQRGLIKVSEKEPVALKICALFMNTENEDRTTFSQDMVNTKKQDWNAEGISMQYFFTVAFSMVNGYLEIYKTLIRSISEWEIGLINEEVTPS